MVSDTYLMGYVDAVAIFIVTRDKQEAQFELNLVMGSVEPRIQDVG